MASIVPLMPDLKRAATGSSRDTDPDDAWGDIHEYDQVLASSFLDGSQQSDLEMERAKFVLLLVTSLMHSKLAFSTDTAVETISSYGRTELDIPFVETIHRRLTSAIRKAVGSYKSMIWVWIALAFAVSAVLPAGYIRAKSIQCGHQSDRSGCELHGMFASKWVVLLGPIVDISAVLLYKIMDTVLQRAFPDVVSKARQFVFTIHFSWVRSRTLSIQHNCFKLLAGISDESVKLLVSFSYVALVVEVLVAAFLSNDYGVGAVIAYAMGEMYLMLLNWMLAPPRALQAVLTAELVQAEPKYFWQSFFEHTGRTIGLGNKEAQAVLGCYFSDGVAQRTGKVQATMPRYIDRVYLTDSNYFIDWADVQRYVRRNKNT